MIPSWSDYTSNSTGTYSMLICLSLLYREIFYVDSLIVAQ